MESEAQWKEVIELSKQIHSIAETALRKYYEENAEELRPHLKSPELFLAGFKILLGKRNELTQSKKKAMQLAVQRVKFTTEMVEGMRKEIEKDREETRVLAEEAQKCGENIVKEKEEIIEVSKKIADEEVEESEATIASRKLAAECEAEVSSIMPAIEKALQSLDLIKPKDIAEIKSMKKPPAVVKLVIAAVAVMLEVEPEAKKTGQEDLRDLYWTPATKMLGDVNFMKRLRDYDKDKISDQVMATLRQEFLNKNPDFEPTRVARASSAAESLCRWIIAMEKYDKVLKEILIPKREALKKAQEQLAGTLQEMKKDKTKLTETEEKVAQLETKLNETVEKKKSFEQQVEKKDVAIGRAKNLIDGLTEEARKWALLVDEYRASYTTIVGDCMLASAFSTYLGPLPQEIRDEAFKGWCDLIATSKENIKCSGESFTLNKYVNDAHMLESWRTADYPQDPLWLDNATICRVNCQRQLWPLCVDPLGVVNKWIKNMEKDNSMEIVKPGDENFIATLKECATSGKPLLLEDITEKLDPQLEHILSRRVAKSSPVESLKIGEEEITVNKDFRFYMTTRLRILKPFFYFKPDEEKEREANFVIINFVPPIPESLALQHALLSGVIAKEKRKLEAERLATIARISTHRLQFLEISDQVLTVLSNPQGGRLISIEMTLGVLEARKPLAEMEEHMKEDEAAMKKIESSLDPFRKLTIKLAKRFCNPGDDELETPFDLEGFIQDAL